MGLFSVGVGAARVVDFAAGQPIVEELAVGIEAVQGWVGVPSMVGTVPRGKVANGTGVGVVDLASTEAKESQHELRKLLAHGYFPKELPPQFSTVQFAETVVGNESFEKAASDQFSNSRYAEICRYSYPKGHEDRRPLAITNPRYQFRLAQRLLESWGDLNSHFDQSRLSLSRPVKTSVEGGRSFEPSWPHKHLYRRQIELGATSRFALHADIAHFYSSTYTHAVSWALHGRDESKKNAFRRKGKRTLIGDLLDSAVQAVQSRESIGLPIGPDTSFVIAEIVGAAIDVRLQDELARRSIPCNGYRHYDDFVLYFVNESDAYRARAILGEILREHHLRLNESKTRVVRLPEAFKADWTYDFSSFRFSDEGSSPTNLARDLNRYLSLALEVQQQLPSEPVLKYALSRFLPRGSAKPKGSPSESLPIPTIYLDTFTAILCQCIMTRPETLAQVFTILRYYKLNAPGFSPEATLTTAVNESIVNCPVESGHELAWALTFATYFGLSLSRSAAEYLQESECPTTIICALDYEASVGGAGTFDKSRWKGLVSDETSLYSPYWLLAYECSVKKWMGLNRSTFRKDEFFKQLGARKVEFYFRLLGGTDEPDEAELDNRLTAAGVMPLAYR